jgi:hypothetical protein
LFLRDGEGLLTDGANIGSLLLVEVNIDQQTRDVWRNTKALETLMSFNLVRITSGISG